MYVCLRGEYFNEGRKCRLLRWGQKKGVGQPAGGRQVLGSGIRVVVVVVLSLIHISEPTRLGMISYAVFCLKKKNYATNFPPFSLLLPFQLLAV